MDIEIRGLARNLVLQSTADWVCGSVVDDFFISDFECECAEILEFKVDNERIKIIAKGCNGIKTYWLSVYQMSEGEVTKYQRENGELEDTVTQ